MRAYSLLLLLYPASFRAEYGAEMAADFRARCREARGLPGRASIWREAVLDTLGAAAALHWDLLRQDSRYALRTLRRSPGFAATAILVSALGIGASTAAFAITDHVLLRPLPFPQPERLVKLWQDQSFRGFSRMELSPANYRDWKAGSGAFESMTAYTPHAANVHGAGEPMRLDGAAATPELFATLGVPALMGRPFGEADARDAGEWPVVVSHGTWVSVFDADPSILGRPLRLNDRPHVVIGVMPPSFDFPDRGTAFWIPLRLAPGAIPMPPDCELPCPGLDDRSNTFLRAIARLAEGVTIDRARAELQGVAARLAEEFPDDNARTGATVVSLRDEIPRQSRILLLALSGAALCLLLIACTNLANLLLARALARRHELVVRAAMGAGRERLVRQTLTESLLLAGAGGALGVALAAVALPVLGRLAPTALPVAEVPGLDLRLVLLACALTIATGVAFGVMPARRAWADLDLASLRLHTAAGGGPPVERLRSTLVVVQIAATIVLVVSSGLLVRALWRVQQVDPGFRPEGVLTVRTLLPLPRYERTETRAAFYRRVLEDVRALPGVENAAYISFLPMTMRGGIWSVTPEGQPPAGGNESRVASLRFVTPGFFDTAGVPLRLGRDVTESDTMGSEMVAVVSESFARQHWPGQNPIGRRFHIAFFDRTIVGLAGDVRVRGLERESEPQVYLPYQQVPDGGVPFYAPKDLLVRTAGTPGLLMPAIRSIVARADPQQAISNVQLLSDIVAADTAARRMQVQVLAGFTAVALLLAGVGLHGLLAFLVSARRKEFGVRLALGAQREAILAMVLRRALALSALGVGLGVPVAYLTARSMGALLAGVSPADTGTLLAAVGIAAGMSLAGSLLPAARASRLNPMEALRAE